MDTITRETLIAASVHRVWDVITRAEHLGRWFGDAGAEIDLRPGGALSLRWAQWGTTQGRVERVDEPTAFSFRWARPNDVEPEPGNSTLVEFTLTPHGDGTLLRVTESGFDSLDASAAEITRFREGNIEGWRHEIGELVEYVTAVAA